MVGYIYKYKDINMEKKGDPKHRSKKVDQRQITISIY